MSRNPNFFARQARYRMITPRRPAADTITTAILGAGKLTDPEVVFLMAPIRDAHKAMREGVATDHQWCYLAHTMNVAMAIERQGIVRGLKDHIHSAELALAAIQDRASATGTWKPTALHWHELDDIASAVDLHEFQLKQLSRKEFNSAVVFATHEVRSTGGRVVRTDWDGHITNQALAA